MEHADGDKCKIVFTSPEAMMEFSGENKLKLSLSTTHMDRGGSGTIILGHPDGSLCSPPDVRIIVPERPPVHVCN